MRAMFVPGGSGDYDRAIADYTAALRIRPNDAETLTGRAQAYLFSGDTNRAIADWEAALRIDPNDDFARGQLEQYRPR